MPAPRDAGVEIARTARVLAAVGLVEAFGHVSARISADEFAITSTRPLQACRADDVHLLSCASPGRAETVPLEAPLHAAVYAAREDVTAICRFHGPATVVWGARGSAPPQLHGLGLMAGEVAWSEESDLVADAVCGATAASALGTADCLLMRANGAVATGASLARAAVRAFFLEERCRVALDAAGQGVALSEPELRARRRWTEAEARRAWTWLAAQAS